MSKKCCSMEGGDICRASSSLRTNSSSIWRNNGVEIFSRSSRGEDDEEALKWAAIEKLPTFNRLKKGLLKESLGVANEVDVQNLGFQERKDLIERLVSIADEDNEKLLLKLKNRIDRVGIEMPRIEVKFERLKVEAEAYVGSRALPTFFNFSVNILEKQLSILNDVSGIIKPCRMTLLLGPPSSGKTTLLLALAGKLDTDLKVSGRVTFNGHEMHEFVPQRTAAYISQHDLHIGEMTVRETLAFSARCQGVGSRYEMLAELSRREKAANIKPDPDIDIFMKAIATEGQEASVVTDYILKVLGLEGCADTMVGDGMIRGISGGQRKRVTTGEMLVGPAKALFMDEISTGLDSSTTFQIVKSLRQYVHILEGTTLISLLQPAPETYDLFDDIILLSDGQIVYQGPREHVLGFFEQMGFKCPERKGVADFLQEVTSKKDQRQYWACKDEPYSFVAVNEFAEAFKSFHVGQMLGDEIAAPFDKTQSHPAALTTRKYGISKKELLKACTSRELLLMKRNSFVYIFKLMQVTVMALITMTLFLRTEMHRNSVTDGGIYTGAMFFTVIMIMFNGLSEISMTIAKLPVFHKQRDLLLYPPWAYAFPTWLLKVPVSCVEVAFWVLFTYYTIGYDPNVGRLFRQYLLLLLVNQMASALFRFIGAAGRNMIVANTFGSFALLMLFALGGFILSRENVKKWWIWGYWMSPLMYGQNAILVNEFLGNSWRHVLKNETESLGVVVLKSRGFFPDAYWYWLGVGALLGFLFLFNFCFTLALTYLNPFGRSQTVIPEESQSNANDDRSGESIQLSSRANSSVGRTVSKERGDQIRRRNITSESSSARTIANVDANKNRKKGMILPFEQHSISFDEIKYSVDMPQEMKEQGVVEDKLMLLKGVSGAFRPGVLTALMGVSGAGKTTLMDVLAGRKTGGYIEGNITVSGYPKKQETFARISGYCEQNDIHSPHVTIYESLLYSAWLRLPPEVNSETRKMFIEEVMELVELTSLRDALVGLPGVSGLSTEQRKRLTIAVELVANPSIIFMDEPTSGLDARAAAIVMRTVRNTVDTGRTVVCTIHQPSIDIFEAFDEIYVGPLGRRSCHLIKYFEGIEGVSKIKDGYNPAAWMLEITASAQELILGVGFAEVYKSSELYRTTQQDLFNAMGSMYTAVLFLGIQNASSVQPVVAVERTVFYRERAAGMYSAMPYAFAQVIIELPHIFAQAIVYGVIVYAMIGFEWTVAKLFWYLFFMYFTLLYFTLYGMMTVAVTPNNNIAAIIASAFYAIWNIFSGFVVPLSRIPIWWRWYYWACPVAWTLYGLVASQFGDIEDTLDTNETVKDFLRNYFGFRHDFVVVAATVVVGFTLDDPTVDEWGGVMEGASSSLRSNSSIMPRNTGVEIFSRSSSRAEEDEEALKWAALERLPTFNRLKKGLLQNQLVLPMKLMKIMKFLFKLKNRIDRVGIDIPTIEVKFEHLNVEAEGYVGSRALPTFVNFSANILEGILNYLHILPSRKKHLSILCDISGIIKPCRLTLLLGPPPSSGKMTLLLALAGKLDTELKISGRVTYNGHGMHEFVPQRTAAYISQHDLHIGEMTNILAELSRREKEANIKPDPDIDIFMMAAATEGQEASVVTDYILKFWVWKTTDTMVGDEMIRGTSGGQRKRVTTGEMLVGSTKVLFMDEISTGLDSSTTFQIVKMLKQCVHMLKGITLVSLLQPAPETYDLFDDIILLSDGQIVYQDPREHVLGFLEHMGFQCPERKGAADFLQEVTSKKDQKQYWRLEGELALPFDKTKIHPATLTTRKYGVSKKELLKACTSRELLLMKRNSFVHIFKLMQIIVMALITMTLFLRTDMHQNSITDGGVYTGSLFFTVIMIMFNGFLEMAMTIVKLPVFHKQRDLLFYPPWAYALPNWILKIPITCVEVAFWVFPTYYVIGYDPNVGRFR
ncbi:unnamed protein product [Camellia sinensis]